MKKYLISLFVFTLASSAAFAGDTVLVAGSNSAIGKLDKSKAAEYFLGKTTTLASGDKAIIVDQPSNAVSTSFLGAVIDKTPDQYKAYWSKMIFTGKGVPPKNLSSDDEVKKFVASNPNALGYISKSSVDSSVKVLLEP
jgi:ABC-type phosphate transport system substrate-binding protein